MSVPAGPMPAPSVVDEQQPAARRRLDGPVARAATVLVLGLIGVQLGLLGGFFTLSTPRPLGIPIPAGLLLAVAANVALGLWSVRLMGRYAIAAPAAGWLVTVLLLASARPEGDLIITSDIRGVAFLLLGSVAWAVAGALGRPGAAPVAAADGGSPLHLR